MKSRPTLSDIRTFAATEHWKTKSNGDLSVLFAIPYDDVLGRFLSYDTAKLARLPYDIRGLRSYRVSGLRRGSIGANEWHKIRNEIIAVSHGSIQLDCSDTRGGTKTFTIGKELCVWIPPYIMHTYTVLEDDTEIMVLANTLFNPSEISSHDTYTAATFNRPTIK